MIKKRFQNVVFYLLVIVVAVYSYYSFGSKIRDYVTSGDDGSFVEKKEPQSFDVCGGQPCNVILIVADTLSAENMSLYGYERKTTPFLDSLAADRALVFDNSVSSASWTPPSMIALFFSRPPYKMHYEDILSADTGLIQTLKDGGVDSVGFVKKFNTAAKVEIKPFVSAVVTNNFTQAGAEQYPSEYYEGNGEGFAAAHDWLQNRQSEKPYFMFIHDVTVHDPYKAPEEFQGIFESAGTAGSYEFSFESPTSTARLSPEEGYAARLAYDQEVVYLDSQIKDFVSGLGDLNNTVVIIVGDHGETFGEVDGYGQHGRPNNVAAAYAYNQVVHVPLVIFGGGIKSGRNECVVSTIDIAPTVLQLFSVPTPDIYEGKNLLSDVCQHDIVYSEQSLIRTEFLSIFSNYESVASEKLNKYTFFEHGEESIFVARNARFKVIEGGGVFKVFDLSKDKKEQHDLADTLDALSEEEKAEVATLREYIKNVTAKSN
ncbi:MAG: hypothetical protein RLZZ480_408 [Candidatus Parcubacteria bacterium]|jgi:arylsulfatase A-like enzyme